MTEVALADYLAYCFSEAVRARQMVDAYSRDLAKAYAQDAVLKEFPVPRFRTPKLTFVVPVLVTDARFQQQSRFSMDAGEFEQVVTSRADQVLRGLEARRDDWTVVRRDRRRRALSAETTEAPVRAAGPDAGPRRAAAAARHHDVGGAAARAVAHRCGGRDAPEPVRGPADEHGPAGELRDVGLHRHGGAGGGGLLPALGHRRDHR
jgi:hypothetical protein